MFITHLAVFMIDHYVMWLHISMHDSHAMAVVKGLQKGAKGLYAMVKKFFLIVIPQQQQVTKRCHLHAVLTGIPETWYCMRTSACTTSKKRKEKKSKKNKLLSKALAVLFKDFMLSQPQHV